MKFQSLSTSGPSFYFSISPCVTVQIISLFRRWMCTNLWLFYIRLTSFPSKSHTSMLTTTLAISGGFRLGLLIFHGCCYFQVHTCFLISRSRVHKGICEHPHRCFLVDRRIIILLQFTSSWLLWSFDMRLGLGTLIGLIHILKDYIGWQLGYCFGQKTTELLIWYFFFFFGLRCLFLSSVSWPEVFSGEPTSSTTTISIDKVRIVATWVTHLF